MPNLSSKDALTQLYICPVVLDYMSRLVLDKYQGKIWRMSGVRMRGFQAYESDNFI